MMVIPPTMAAARAASGALSLRFAARRTSTILAKSAALSTAPRSHSTLVRHTRRPVNRAPESTVGPRLSSTNSSSPPLLTLTDEASSTTLAFLPDGLVSLVSPTHGIPASQPFVFDHVWLRDACTELGSSLQVGSGQKLFHTSDIHVPEQGKKWGLLEASSPPKLIPSDGSSLPLLELTYSASHPVLNAFSLTFSSTPPVASASPHVSRLPLSLLVEHANAALYAASHGDIGGLPVGWDKNDTRPFDALPSGGFGASAEWSQANEAASSSKPAVLSWSHLQSSEPHKVQTEDGRTIEVPLGVYARERLLSGLVRDGFAFVQGLETRCGRGVGNEEEGVPKLKELAESLGEIRNTFYGPLWDVISLGSSSKNIAYTNVDLGLHMDLCYFQNPPRFQFLHMLRNRVKGGESIFVDSFKAAQEMWDEDREAWRLLAETPVGFHYQNDGRHYRYTHPTFEVAPSTSGHAGGPMAASSMPRLTAINYSPPFQSPLPLHGDPSVASLSPAGRAAFYRALAKFADLCHEPRFVYERFMREGECVVFDNRRALHARRGFEWDEREETTSSGAAGKDGKATGNDKIKRWLKGCYVDGDAIWSSWRTHRALVQGGKLGQL